MQRARTVKMLDVHWRFYVIDYEDVYKDIPMVIKRPKRMVAELYMFRVWLTLLVYRRMKPDLVSEEEILSFMIPFSQNQGHNLFQARSAVNVEKILGKPLREVMQSRFDEYDRALGSSTCDTKDLRFGPCAGILAFQIAKMPTLETVIFLERKAWEQFRDIAVRWESTK